MALPTFLTLICLSATEVALPCPSGRPALRGPAIHTQADHACGCTDARGGWQGPYQERFASGAVAVSGQYRHGETDGIWVFYYSNGRDLSRGILRAGRRQGRWTFHDESGQRIEEGPYRDGVQDGRWTSWHAGGARQSEGSYRNGIKTGRWTYWYSNGRLEKAGVYRGAHTHPERGTVLPAESGIWTFWYESGNKRLEICFRGGEEARPPTEWSEDGRLISTMKPEDRACKP